MKCPHCDKEIAGIACPQCGSVSPEEAKFCIECGVSLVQETEETFENNNGFDPEDRILCSDGTCTGIIVDGKCTECGKIPGDEEKVEEKELIEEET